MALNTIFTTKRPFSALIKLSYYFLSRAGRIGGLLQRAAAEILSDFFLETIGAFNFVLKQFENV